VTTASLAGTFLSGQVAGSDQRWAAGDPAFWAWTTANALTSRNAGRSEARRNERCCVLTESTLRTRRWPRTAAARRSAIRRPADLEPQENSRFRRSQACDSRQLATSTIG